jgi:hypothetical protein
MDSVNYVKIEKFINSQDFKSITKEHVLAKKCYLDFVSSNDEKVSKSEFLYVWFCVRSKSMLIPRLLLYDFFNDENYPRLSKMSYWDFTQSYISSSSSALVEDVKVTICYECFFDTDVYTKYPISLRSFLDKLPLEDRKSKIVLVEGRLAIFKCKPKIMNNSDINPSDFTHFEKDTLTAYFKDSSIKVNDKCVNVISKDASSHSKYVEIVKSLVKVSEVVENKCRQAFHIPNREINYDQIVKWLNDKNVHCNDKEDEWLSVPNIFNGVEMEIHNKRLESNKCYEAEDAEIYRLRGEKVLTLTGFSDVSKDIIESRLRNIFKELDRNLEEKRVDPMDLDASNIAKLRATNHKLFDSEYCRKAPRDVQPLVIKQSEVSEHLARGKIILIYEGKYYTTQDGTFYANQKFVGMINRFGEYDPRKIYLPIIRTYKKNHLLSEGFKEIKLYLLRFSDNPNRGRISREDILLPKHLERLYDVDIVNPDFKTSQVHSKKTSTAKNTKVVTSEVPDYIKETFRTSNVKRVTIQGIGTKLLECCEVDRLEFLKFATKNLYKYFELSSCKSPEEVEKEILKGTMDHRIYGKMIEDLTEKSLLVFSSSEVVPYRYSKCKKALINLLFVDDEWNYYKMMLPDVETMNKKTLANDVNKVVKMINNCKAENFNKADYYEPRPVDYTRVTISLVSYLIRFFESQDYEVSVELVSEERCKELVEDVYNEHIYYEGMIKTSDSRYSLKYIETRKQQIRIKLSVHLMNKIFHSLICKLTSKKVILYSCVDMTKYAPWNMLLEDCLYYSPRCYHLASDEEVQYVKLLDVEREQS